MSSLSNPDTATSTGPASSQAAFSAPRPNAPRDSWLRTESDIAYAVPLIGMAARHLRRLLASLLARRAALLSAAGVCMVQPARVRRAASAWNSGKSHRAFDEPLAQAGPG